MDRLTALVAKHPLPTWRVPARLIMALLAAAIIWSYFARLDEVAVAAGEVVPKGNVRVIQHLEGGIIEKLDVREGDAVAAGDPLVRLDLATSGLNRDELQARLDGNILTRARLEAEANGTEPVFPPDVAKRRPSIVEAETKAYHARMRELEATLRVLREQVNQRGLEVEELEARRKAVATNLTLARERLKMSGSLLSQGLTAKMEHLKLRAEVEGLEGQLETLKPALPKARAAEAEVHERLEQETTRFQRKVQEDLGRVEQEIARVDELLHQATEQGLRAQIRSPLDGVVKNLRFHTIGGVVRPGEPIMEIVPSTERLVVEAHLSPVDRGYVEVGQEATVKVSTYDFVRYGGLDGKVVLIAPDTTTGPNGTAYFRVVVETTKTYLGDREGVLPITPGMQAVVDIHTGSKSVMQYLIEPVLKLRHEAFRER
jgi:adhesin transport system membrane fusion protein